MTNEQAIELIMSLKWDKNIDEQEDKALSMAIEALQQGCKKVAEGCDDLIRRQDAIDAIGNRYMNQDAWNTRVGENNGPIH